MGPRSRLLLVVLPALFLIVPAATLAADSDYAVDPESGFRMERYRAPVPASVPGGTTIDTATAMQLHQEPDVTFIDVYPPTGLGADPLDGRWLTNDIRESIPGALWLPEVGRGYLDKSSDSWFRDNLQSLSRGAADHPFVFFCTADCWQSWNATRRAASYGYARLYWYPLGSDGWRDEGGRLEIVEPVNALQIARPAPADTRPPK